LPVVVTVRSPDASMSSSSATFRTAFTAVGEHTPPEQVMCFVAWFEITTAAAAVEIAIS
jgi:hypothetical protein